MPPGEVFFSCILPIKKERIKKYIFKGGNMAKKLAVKAASKAPAKKAAKKVAKPAGKTKK